MILDERDKSRFLKHAPWLAFAAILAYQLFVPPSIGLSNNGDFSKIMGLFSLGGSRGDEYKYVNLTYQFDPRYHWEAGYYSSETLLAATAIGLSRVFSKTGSFDLRWMGLIHGSLFLLAVYLMHGLLTDVGSWRWYVRWIASALIFGDVMYVSYFNSMYMDAAAYVFLALSVVLFLRAAAWRKRTDAMWLVICTALLLLSKPQHAVLGVWIAPLFIFFRRNLWPGNSRLFATISTTVVAAAAIVSTQMVPADYAAHGYYSVIFFQILPHSRNVKGDLEALGLDESFAKFAGTHAFSAESGLRDPAVKTAFMQRTSYARLGWFFLRHPRDAYIALRTSLDEGGRQRPAMGNFDRSAGLPPFTESQAFAFWSDANRTLFHDHGVRYLNCFMTITVLICATATARRTALPGVLVAGIYALAGMGLTEMLVASLADAVDVPRHHFIATTIFHLELLMLVVLLTRRVKAPGPYRSGAAAETLTDCLS